MNQTENPDISQSANPAKAKSSRFLVIARYLLLSLGILTIALLLGGQMGLLSGKRPVGLGAQNGQLKPAPSTRNCVSSQATSDYHKIAPLAYTGDPQAAFDRLKGVVNAMPRAMIISSKPGYLYAEYTTKLLGFVDDVEFYLDEKAGVIQVRSASRLGREDFGVNRARIETIRAAFNNASN